MNKRKPLKELNLLDKFLFDEAMDDPENVKTEVKYMQSWEEKILIKQEGIAEGIAEGERIGLERINRLNQKLIEQGRFDDLTKATSDSGYQEKLLKEFQI